MIVVVPVDPPRVGLANSSLAQSGLNETELARLYEASIVDVIRVANASGGELLLNYRNDSSSQGGDDVEALVRELASRALEDAVIRFEPQVGSSRSARIGNTVTHLLERERVETVGVIEPTAALVERTTIDGAAMALRRNDVVLGPTLAGDVYFAGFSKPIDFTDAYATPALATLALASHERSLTLGFSPALPTISSETGLVSTIATLEARTIADHPGGEAIATVIDDLGLEVSETGTLER